MNDKHLLYWIFKVSEKPQMSGPDGRAATMLDKDDFDAHKAPDWVWPSYQANLKEYKEINK